MEHILLGSSYDILTACLVKYTQHKTKNQDQGIYYRPGYGVYQTGVMSLTS